MIAVGLVLGFLASIGFIGSAFGESVDITSVFFGVVDFVGLSIGYWRRRAAAILFTLVGILAILVGYFTRNGTVFALGIISQLSAFTIIFAAASRPR